MYATRPLVGFAVHTKLPVATGASNLFSAFISGGRTIGEPEPPELLPLLLDPPLLLPPPEGLSLLLSPNPAGTAPSDDPELQPSVASTASAASAASAASDIGGAA